MKRTIIGALLTSALLVWPTLPVMAVPTVSGSNSGFGIGAATGDATCVLIANRTGSVACASGAVALGYAPYATGDSVAIGNQYAYGGKPTNGGFNNVRVVNLLPEPVKITTVSIGGLAASGGSANVQLGDFAHKSAPAYTYNVMVGTNSYTDGYYDVAMGTGASIAGASNSVTVGHDARTSATAGTAIGSGSTASGNTGVAVGFMATAAASGTVTIGGTRNTAGSDGIYQTGSSTAGVDTVSLGTDNTSSVTQAVFIGKGAASETALTVRIGSSAVGTTNANSVVIGQNASAVGSAATSSSYRVDALNQRTGVSSTSTQVAVVGSNQVSNNASLLGSGSSGSFTIQGLIVGVGSQALLPSTSSETIGSHSNNLGVSDVMLGSRSVAGSRGVTIGYLATQNLQGATPTDVTVIAGGTTLGYSAAVTADGGIALGSSPARLVGQDTVANTSVSATNGIALGTSANAAGASAVAVSTGASAGADNAVAVGVNAKALNNAQVVLGRNASAVAVDAKPQNLRIDTLGPAISDNPYSATVIGDAATGLSGSVAIGDKASATTESIVLGASSGNAYADEGATIIGSLSDGELGATVLGAQALSSANGVALGHYATAKGASGIAVGNSANAIGANSIAIGGSPSDSATQDTTTQTRANGISSIAMGTQASAVNDYDMAIGTGAIAAGGNALALGANANALANSVALGTQSVTSGGAQTGYVAPFLSTPVNSVGEVSVGKVGALRKITNVAPGQDPTDAVTVEQASTVGAALTALISENLSFDLTLGAWNGLHNGVMAPISNVAEGSSAGDAVNMAQLNALSNKIDAIQTQPMLRYSTTENEWSASYLGRDQAISRVAAGTEPDDIADVAQLRFVENFLQTSGDNLMTFDAASNSWVSQRANVNEKIINVADGAITADSTDLINGRQVYLALGENTEEAQLVNGRGGRYLRTNDNTLADAAGDNDAHANGVGSTAAGFEATAAGADSLAIGDTAMAQMDNSVVLGANATDLRGAQSSYTAYALDAVQSSAGELALNNMQITGVAAGSASTDAVNVSQLRAVQNQLNQLTSDAFSGGTSLSGGVLTANAGGAPVRVSNIAAGKLDTDLANLAQMKDQIGRITTESNAYVDSLASAQNNLDGTLSRIKADIAAGMAVAGLPIPTEAGHSLVGLSASYFGSENGFALGYIAMPSQWAYRIAATANTRGNFGGSIGLSHSW